MIYQEQTTSKESPLANIWLYVAFAMSIVMVFGYFMFSVKIYVENQRTSALTARIASVSALPAQKEAGKSVTDYQKKFADYRTLSTKHRTTSHIFAFIEERVLPNVWFSSFDMTQLSEKLTLVGEAENMATASRQIKVFEDSVKYIKSVSVLHSEVQSSGRVTFLLSILLDPTIVNYAQVPTPPVTQTQNP